MHAAVGAGRGRVLLMSGQLNQITRTKRFQDYGSCAELKIRYEPLHLATCRFVRSASIRCGPIVTTRPDTCPVPYTHSVVARNNDILKRLVLEAKREYEKDAEHRVHIFMADTYVRCAHPTLPYPAPDPTRADPPLSALRACACAAPPCRTYGCWRWNGARQKRPMSSIVLEPGVKDMILADCKDFLASEDW